MRVEDVPLPGIGLRQVITTDDDQHVGVVCHHNGRRDLVVYRPDDPDAALSVTLTRREAAALARLLGLVEVGETECGCHQQPTVS
ncbi:potassium transporter TrkA [Micromonospora sp. NPDC003197]